MNQLNLFGGGAVSSEELAALLQLVNECIADAHNDATLIPWDNEASDPQAAISAAVDAFTGDGWTWNKHRQHLERGEWYLWFRSQGRLSSPIAQWNTLESLEELERSISGARDPRNDRPKDWEDEDEE